MTPLFVNSKGRRIVIFGGGNVAARKAAYFTPDADVQLVSRSFSKKCISLPVRRQVLDLRNVSDKKLDSIIGSAFLVIAAMSDRNQNNRIGRICARKKILFNNADGTAGDVILPSVIRGQEYVLAISTMGSSPAISRFLREHLETTCPELDRMIVLQRSLRAMLRQKIPVPAARQAVLAKILRDPEVWDFLQRDPDKAQKFVMEKYADD